MIQLPQRKTLLFLFLILFLIIVVINVSTLTEWLNYRSSVRHWKQAVQVHRVPTNDRFEEIWSSTAFINCISCLMSTEDSVYLLGSLKNNTPEFLIGFDLLTGKVKWQKELNHRQSRQTLWGFNTKHIYVGRAATEKIAGPTQLWGAAEVVAYNVESQNEIWSRRFAGSRGIIINKITEEVIVVNGNGLFYQINADTGREISDPQHQVLLSDDGKVQYIQQFTNVHGLSIATGEVIWSQEISPFSQLIFGNDTIIIGKGDNQTWGSVTVLDGATGEILWEYDRVISNVAINGTVAFFLVLGNGTWGLNEIVDTQLLAIDIKTGATLGTLIFEPSGIQSGSGNYGYNVAASNYFVLVYLGDGRQLFAFRFFSNE